MIKSIKLIMLILCGILYSEEIDVNQVNGLNLVSGDKIFVLDRVTGVISKQNFNAQEPLILRNDKNIALALQRNDIISLIRANKAHADGIVRFEHASITTENTAISVRVQRTVGKDEDENIKNLILEMYSSYNKFGK